MPEFAFKIIDESVFTQSKKALDEIFDYILSGTIPKPEAKVLHEHWATLSAFVQISEETNQRIKDNVAKAAKDLKSDEQIPWGNER